jgi:predicted nucleic acid-binding protein
VVVDASAIVAGYDDDHPECHGIRRVVADESARLVISPLIVAEADYMLARHVGRAAAVRFAEDLAAEAYEVVDWACADHAEALSVVNAYTSDYVGMADASNVVIADRFRTNQILTLDQRHFRLLQPLWGFDHFALLPFDES